MNTKFLWVDVLFRHPEDSSVEKLISKHRLTSVRKWLGKKISVVCSDTPEVIRLLKDFFSSDDPFAVAMNEGYKQSISGPNKSEFTTMFPKDCQNPAFIKSVSYGDILENRIKRLTQNNPFYLRFFTDERSMIQIDSVVARYRRAKVKEALEKLKQSPDVVDVEASEVSSS